MGSAPKFQHLHTTLCVRDLDRARAFYSDLLGLEEIVDRPLSFPGLWYDLGTAQLHLILDVDATPPYINPEKWGRAPHLALYVPDIEPICQRLDAGSIAYQRSASGRPAIFLRDADSNTIELCATLRTTPNATPNTTPPVDRLS